MFLDDSPKPGQAMHAHVRRHLFIYLSVVLHAAALGAFYYLGNYRIEHGLRRQSLESGERLTAHVRLEKRVHDMARIKSLLERSAAVATGDERAAQAAARQENDVQFSEQPKAPSELLKQARALSRAIDKIERDTKAEELAKLLNIPQEKALQQLLEGRKPEALSSTEPHGAAEEAAAIERLEARARDALEQRRLQLEQRQNGTAVTASESRAGGNERSASPGPRGQSDGGGQHPTAAERRQGGAAHGTRSDTPFSSVLEGMAEFTNPDMPDHATKQYAEKGVNQFFDRGLGHIPEVVAGAVLKGAGRVIGPGGTFADRVYVNRWYLIGPFEGKHGEGLFNNYRHPPEQGVVLDAVYQGKSDRLLKWEYIDASRYPLIPADSVEDAVYYGYTELMIDQEQDLTIWVGADDDAQLWLNDKLVWKGGNVNKRWFSAQAYGAWNTNARDYNLSEGKRVVHLRKGRNKLFFKLSNGPTRMFFSLVLTKPVVPP